MMDLICMLSVNASCMFVTYVNALHKYVFIERVLLDFEY